MSPARRPLLFFLFFVSGFCGLLYQVVWTRLAFASFGIITPVLSVVISVFMLGLSLGSWAGGRWIGVCSARTGLSAIGFYAVAEFIIGIGAFAVPSLFTFGQHCLLALGPAGSLKYLVLSALVLAGSILPWCVCMGATFPLVMAYVRERDARTAESFSFLYLANVLGAMAGTLLSALVLIECLGFRHTLWVAAAGNFLIAGISVWLAAAGRTVSCPQSAVAGARNPDPGTCLPSPRLVPAILFWTGFASMAMEVVWIRAFAPVVKTQVYSFALVLATYLGATFLGSLLYRRDLKAGSARSTAELLGWLCAAAFFPIIVNDPRWVKADWLCTPDPLSVVIVLAGICPFCAVLGYLTPRLVDQYAGGEPAAAGRAYALNVLGCILGPLFAGYGLLLWMSDRSALLLLGLPFFAFYFFGSGPLPARRRLGLGAAAAALLACALFFSRSYEDHVLKVEKHAVVRRDYAASVLSYGEGLEKLLCVNGIGMTTLTPVTKFMVHLPLAFHPGRAESVLVICFGMGTTYRSALSWDVKTTAVELVPSVKDAFGFYHADAARALQNPNGRIVVDDGRRFLERTRDQYDVIVIDPPPPVEAAGSSLLYSKEFYEVAKQRLKPHGILEAWYPGGDLLAARAITRSITECFPYVRLFGGVEGYGTHFLASMEPIPQVSAAELVARLPAAAAKDLQEWNPGQDLTAWFGQVVANEYEAGRVVHPDPSVCITDDRPYNEYFLLRGKQL
jgi:spermidine synthase